MRDLIKYILSFIMMFIICFIICFIFLMGVLYFVSHLPAIFPKIDLISATNHIHDDVTLMHYASMVILTMVLVIVAGIQLGKLNRTTTADFLLRIDSRYGSKEIVAARALIQSLYRKANPSDNPVCEEIYMKEIAKEIKSIRESQNGYSAVEFSYLLNMLDFLETISLFARKNYITVRDVDDLIGNSMIFYYKIYKEWIYYRRNTYSNPSYYCDFEWLVGKLESRQAKEKLARNCIILRIINYFY